MNDGRMEEGILVTGASGFIGKYVTDALCGGVRPVIVLVRDRGRYQVRGQEIVIEGDLSRIEPLYKALSPYRIRACVHLAWEGIPDYSFEMSQKNLTYGVNLLKLCRTFGIGQLIVAGSCWEYKDPAGKISEDWPLDDANHFKAAKNSFRAIGHAFCREYGICFNWLRLFYVYGDGQREGALIPSVTRELSMGRLPALRGGANRNDFIHASDVAAAVVKTLEKRPEEEVFNIGSGNAVRVFDLLKMAADEMDIQVPDSADVYKTAATDFYADTCRAQTVLEWKPSISIQKGLQTTVSRRAAS